MGYNKKQSWREKAQKQDSKIYPVSDNRKDRKGVAKEEFEKALKKASEPIPPDEEKKGT